MNLPLNENLIRESITFETKSKPLRFHLFQSVDSTNRVLKEFPASQAIDICLAETQTNGRGRFGRHWHSPFGENIYCSISISLDKTLSQLSGLSLVVSLAVINALRSCKIKEKISVKWPNDMLFDMKKLGGCLIEMGMSCKHGSNIVIGIGLNINSKTESSSVVERPWCSLYDITGKTWDRNIVIAHILTQLQKHLIRFTEEGFTVFLDEWHLVDALYGQEITVSHQKIIMNGIAKGVSHEGYLVLLDKEGQTHFLSSGDTSLHVK